MAWWAKVERNSAGEGNKIVPDKLSRFNRATDITAEPSRAKCESLSEKWRDGSAKKSRSGWMQARLRREGEAVTAELRGQLAPASTKRPLGD